MEESTAERASGGFPSVNRHSVQLLQLQTCWLLKLSLRPGGGKYCFFSETVFDHKVVGCPVLIAKAAVPIRENFEAIKSRLASLPGRSQNRNGIDDTDTRGNGDHCVSVKHKEFP